jgi:hypothetical protein
MSRAKSIKSILDGISTARLNFLERVEDSRLLEQRIQSVHDEVNRTYLEPDINTLQETYEVVADRRGLTPEDVKAVEGIVARRAGGGAGEGVLGEMAQDLRSAKRQVKDFFTGESSLSVGQQISRDISGEKGGAKATVDARDKNVRTKALGLLAVLGTVAWYENNDYDPTPEELQEVIDGLDAARANKESTFKIGDTVYDVPDIPQKELTGFKKAYSNAVKAGEPDFEYTTKDGVTRLYSTEMKTNDPDVVFARIEKNNGSLMTPREGYRHGTEVNGQKVSLWEAAKNALMSEEAQDQARIRQQAIENMPPMPGTNVSTNPKEDSKNVEITIINQGTDKAEAPPVDQSTPYQRKQQIKQFDQGLEESDNFFLPVRKGEAEGGMQEQQDMPVDTYPNIPPDEMAEVEASQLPDDEMEEGYLDYVVDESLDNEEQDYLMNALEADPKLSQIFDKVIDTASEFSGAGEVEGPGTGVSDSIPARLSDGEFVITKKATDAIGADNLQAMMDEAERADDSGQKLRLAFGGMAEKEDELEDSKDYLSKTDEEIKKVMIGSNRMPSVR